jgi:hypothetical protein
MAVEQHDQRWENRSGLVFAIDNHIVDGDTSAELDLKRFHTDGWIELVLTDVTRTEWLTAKPERKPILEDLAISYAEYWGPAVVERSRLGSAVVGSPEDQERLERVFGILFPGTVMETSRQQHTYDAMNVATAIRYGVNGFVTNEKRLQNKRHAIEAAFDGFSIFSPQRAVAISNRIVAGWRAIEARGSG